MELALPGATELELGLLAVGLPPGMVLNEPGADLVLEGLLFLRERQVHDEGLYRRS